MNLVFWVFLSLVHSEVGFRSLSLSTKDIASHSVVVNVLVHHSVHSVEAIFLFGLSVI